ncbi:TonB-dependent receptor [Candidatus Nitrosacidococcus tergens]|uniref:TonB-dependent receptor n=1 Tax=Candidatus Nitrosacidococcus tergens TaxID=553981 RepID=A0A7G1QA53_9GAMM|nr:TonB-dependent receptor [Candidatus Nitrosacidococcus tergens]CAB1276284.1 TonB-dependent receptor [Candidatus Nitrosacidococcus tergens]
MINRIFLIFSRFFILNSFCIFTTPIHADQKSEEINQAAKKLESITVTAPFQVDNLFDLGTSKTILEGNNLHMKAADTIGETLKQELGVSNQSFGPGVGRVMIRGQTGPRVRELFDSIGSNDASSISPDHATTVEPLLAERIEVLRGPESLLYGSGAVGGVVNVISNLIPESQFEHIFSGGVEQRYNSVSNETASVMKLEGGRDSIAFHIDGFYTKRDNMSIGGQAIDEVAAHVSDPSLPKNLENPHGILPNTFGESISGSVGASWVGNIGFAGIGANHLENNYGIPLDGTGDETTRIALQQNRYDFKSKLNNPFEFAQSLRMRLGYTDYQHTEITNGEASDFFMNRSYEGRIELTHQPLRDWNRGMIGIHAIASDFTAFDKGDGDTLIPHSQINNFGVFAVENFETDLITYQLGMRVENDSIVPENLSGFNYTPISVSGSALWKINHQSSLNLSLARAERAPQVQELLMNGYHDATRSFELGNTHLKKETFYNLDLGYEFNSNWMHAELNLFHNWAENYIFQQRNGELATEEGKICPSNVSCAPVVVTSQAAATFKGFEGKLEFPLMENQYGLVNLTLLSDYTRGQFTTGGDVPRMPPLRYGFRVDYAKDNNLSAHLQVLRANRQKYAGQFEAPTAGYILLDLGAQYRIESWQVAEFMIFAKGTNLLNQNVRNATSYLRNFAPEPGRGAEIGIRANF